MEKKDKYSGLWEKALETPGPDCKTIVRGLIEGQQYQFRVVAVNKAGPSILTINYSFYIEYFLILPITSGEPSDGSKPITAKARFLAPRIDRKNLRDITLSAGSTLKFDVDVTGKNRLNTYYLKLMAVILNI